MHIFINFVAIFAKVRVQGIVLANHLCTCVLQLSLLHTLKKTNSFIFMAIFIKSLKEHFAHPKILLVHPELPFLAKSMVQGADSI